MDGKSEIRAAVRTARAARAQDTAQAQRDRAGLTRELISLVDRLGATRVACFVSVRDEPDTAAFLTWATEHGVDVILPRSLPGGLLAWGSPSAGPLVPGAFGIPEPVGADLAPGALATVDLVLVPAAAVARDGARLGWGLGYYDRELGALRQSTLDDAPPVYAVVFESEIVDQIPTNPHDVAVDGAISELRTHRFS